MKTFDVTYYDFDRSENTMSDGHHMDVEAVTLLGAIHNALKQLADYDEGTQGWDDYLSITEVNVRDEHADVTAYRVGEKEWEIHYIIEENGKQYEDVYSTFV